MNMVFSMITIRPAKGHNPGPNRHIQPPVLPSEGCIGITTPRTGSLQLPRMRASFLTGAATDGMYEPGDPVAHLLAGSLTYFSAVFVSVKE